jgi:hypothetical protein
VPRLRLTIRRLTALAALAGAAALPAGATAQAPSAGWQRADLRPVTQPAAVGGLFVMYTSRNGGLRVVGIDPATGRTVWSQLASPSRTTTSQAPSLGVVGGSVIYLGRAVADTARVVAADARTGATLWQSGVGTFSSYPEPCAAPATVICVAGTIAGGPRGAELRFDAATGAPLRSADLAGTDAFAAAPGFLDSDFQPERLTATAGGAVAWSRRLEVLFPNGNPARGFNFDRVDAAGMFVGSVGANGRTRRGRFVDDLSRDRTAGIGIADGRVAWRRPGFYACGNVICPGRSQAGFNQEASAPSIGIRVVSTGTLSGPDEDNAFTPSRVVDAKLEGFDPRTGRALWRFDAGRNFGLVAQTDFGAQTGPLQLALRDAEGRLRVVDLATGRRSAAPARGWCRREIEFRQTVAVDGEHVYEGQPALLPCSTATERRVGTPATVPAFVAAVGATVSGLVAWTDRGGLFARPPAP